MNSSFFGAEMGNVLVTIIVALFKFMPDDVVDPDAWAANALVPQWAHFKDGLEEASDTHGKQLSCMFGLSVDRYSTANKDNKTTSNNEAASSNTSNDASSNTTSDTSSNKATIRNEATISNEATTSNASSAETTTSIEATSSNEANATDDTAKREDTARRGDAANTGVVRNVVARVQETKMVRVWFASGCEIGSSSLVALANTFQEYPCQNNHVCSCTVCCLVEKD